MIKGQFVKGELRWDDYYCLFDGMIYFLWIDSITAGSDEVIEMQIGCVNEEKINGENAKTDRVEIKHVTDEYQKINIIMEMIKAIQKGR